LKKEKIMSTKTNVETEVTFDLIKTLMVIESDKDLTEVLRTEYGTEFPLMYAMARDGGMKKKAEKFIRGIFEKLITTKPNYLEKYMGIENVNEVLVKDKNLALPKWYGKKNIDADIKAQGGKMTEVQRAMLRTNDLKNIFSKLSRKGISDMLGGTEKLSDTDCKTIIASIDTLEKKLRGII
jgi:hypothetical protein